MTDDGDVKALRRCVTLLVKLKLRELRGDKSLKDMIQLLADTGCGPSEIAELLNTTTSTVNPVLSRARGKKSSRRKKS